MTGKEGRRVYIENGDIGDIGDIGEKVLYDY